MSGLVENAASLTLALMSHPGQPDGHLSGSTRCRARPRNPRVSLIAPTLDEEHSLHSLRGRVAKDTSNSWELACA